MDASTHRDDRARPLTPAGRTAAAAAARRIAAAFSVPPKLIASPTCRTQQTTRIVAAAYRPTLPVHAEPGIYEAAVGTLLALVQGQPDAVRHLLLCGHNPGVSGLARYLVVDGPVIADLAPGEWVSLEFAVARWPAVARASGVAARP